MELFFLTNCVKIAIISLRNTQLAEKGNAMSKLSEGCNTQSLRLFHLSKDVQVSNITITAQDHIGSQIKSSSYHKVVFSNCVFFSVQFKDILFNECIFENCTFEFSHMDQCVIKNCLFENNQWTASTAKKSVIENGSMDGATLEIFKDLIEETFEEEIVLALAA